MYVCICRYTYTHTHIYIYVYMWYVAIITFSMPITALQGHNRSRLRVTPWPMRNEPLVVDLYMRLRIVVLVKWKTPKWTFDVDIKISLTSDLPSSKSTTPSIHLKRNVNLFANQITRGYRRRLKMISLASWAILVPSKSKGWPQKT